MNTVTLFVLLAINIGGIYEGNVTKIGAFESLEFCNKAKDQVENKYQKSTAWICLEANLWRKKTFGTTKNGTTKNG